MNTETKALEAIWTTKTGDKIPVSKMDDSHLVNTIRFVRRNYQAIMLHQAILCDSAYPDGEPDGAAMAAESEARYAFSEAEELNDIQVRVPIYKHLVKEANKRKLDHE